MARMLRVSGEPSRSQVEEVARVVRHHGVIAVPTESFYALGASAGSAGGLARVMAIKGRPDGKPILLLIAGRADLPTLIEEEAPAAAMLMDRFWPGPLTIVFKASPAVAPALTGGTGTIGVRQPAHPVLLALLRETGPLTGTSANRSGEPPPSCADEVEATLGAELDLIVDGGETPGNAPSTVVDARGPVRVLREGPITRQQIRTALIEAGLDHRQLAL